jgi:AbrB family looped-hinge helix DNA binding protein
MGDFESFDDLFFGAVTIGERGQVVIPAEARKKCGMEPGDRILAFYAPWSRGITFVRVEMVHRLHEMMRQMVDITEQLKQESADEEGEKSD